MSFCLREQRMLCFQPSITEHLSCAFCFAYVVQPLWNAYPVRVKSHFSFKVSLQCHLSCNFFLSAPGEIKVSSVYPTALCFCLWSTWTMCLLTPSRKSWMVGSLSFQETGFLGFPMQVGRQTCHHRITLQYEKQYETVVWRMIADEH